MKCILCSTEIEEGMTECPKCGSSFGIPQKESTEPKVEDNNVVEENNVQSTETNNIVDAPTTQTEVVVPPVSEEPPAPQVEQVPQENLGTVNLDNVSEPKVVPPAPSNAPTVAPINAEPVESSSSIVPIIFIVIIACALGYVGYLLATGHKIFGDNSITEDVTTTTTIPTTTTGTVIDTTTTTVPTSEPVSKTTTPVNLTDEKLVSDIDNYTVSAKLTMKVQGMNMNITMNGVVDQKNKKDKIKCVTAVSGNSVTIMAYYDFNTGYIYMEDPTNKGTWIKQRNTDQFVDLESYIKRLNSMKDVTKVDEGHYKVKVSKEEIKNLMNQSGLSTSQFKSEPEIHIYTKDGYITKIESDFSNVIKDVDNFKLSYSFSLYDKSGEVDIPQSVISSAKLQ